MALTAPTTNTPSATASAAQRRDADGMAVASFVLGLL